MPDRPARPAAVALVAAALTLAASGSPARADEGSSGGWSGGAAARFGGTGQWVLSLSHPSEFPLQLLKTGGAGWDLLLQPSADTFLATNVSVGGLVKFVTNDGGSEIGVGARGGYNVGLTGLLSLWMRAGLFFHRIAPAAGGSYTQTIFDVKAPLLVHLAPHFFAGAGPTVSLFLTRGDEDSKPVTFGFLAIIGGYFL